MVELESVDLGGNDDLFLLSDLYEVFPKSNAIKSVILYFTAFIGIIFLLTVTPDYSYTRRLDIEARPDTRELLFQASAKKISFFHKSISFGIRVNSNFTEEISCTITGSVNYKLNNRPVHQFTLDNSVFVIESNKNNIIFNTGKTHVDEVTAHLSIVPVDNHISKASTIWIFENSSWLVFVLGSKIILFLGVLFAYVQFLISLHEQKNGVPSYIQSFMKRMSPFFLIAFFPVSEAEIFFESDFLTKISDCFHLASTVTVVSFFHIITWDLYLKNKNNEPIVIERMMLLLIFISISLVAPRFVKYEKLETKNFVFYLLPNLVLVFFSFILTFVPKLIRRKTLEYNASILHLILSFIPSLITLLAYINESERNSKFMTLSTCMNGISFIFLFIYHWPVNIHTLNKEYLGIGVIVAEDE